MGEAVKGERIEGGTVAKAFSLLDMISSQGRPMRFTALREATGMPKATLHRFLVSLTDLGLLHHDPEHQTYGLGLRLVGLAHTTWQHFSLAPIARPHVDALVDRVGETVHLAQLDHGHVLYLDKRNAGPPTAMYSQTGKIAPAYCTGVGKAILAFLSPIERAHAIVQQSFHRFTPSTITDPERLESELHTIAERGYALDIEEHEEGIICISAPIRSDHGHVYGAISITGSLARIDVNALVQHVPVLLETAGLIALDARLWRAPT